METSSGDDCSCNLDVELCQKILKCISASIDEQCVTLQQHAVMLAHRLRTLPEGRGLHCGPTGICGMSFTHEAMLPPAGLPLNILLSVEGQLSNTGCVFFCTAAAEGLVLVTAEGPVPDSVSIFLCETWFNSIQRQQNTRPYHPGSECALLLPLLQRPAHCEEDTLR